MKNTVYHDKSLGFTKAVSNTISDMKNIVYRDNPLMIFLGYVSGKAHLPSSGSEYILQNTFEFIKAVSDTVLDMINFAYHDKPWMFIGAMLRSSKSCLIAAQ